MIVETKIKIHTLFKTEVARNYVGNLLIISLKEAPNS